MLLKGSVKSVGGVSEPHVRDVCSDTCHEWGKWTEYPGKLLAQGSKEMELELAQPDNLELSNDEDKEDARASPQVKEEVRRILKPAHRCRREQLKMIRMLERLKMVQEGDNLNSNRSANVRKQQSVKRRQTVSRVIVTNCISNGCNGCISYDTGDNQTFAVA